MSSASPGAPAVEVKTHQQVRALAAREVRPVVNIERRVAVAREDDVEARFGEPVADLLGEPERGDFLLLPADNETRVLPAVAGIETDGADALAGSVFRRKQH